MIQTEADLKDLVQRATKAKRIALDTEFFWERTFYPILGVVQVGFSERECYLVDAMALPTLPYFGELLENADCEKILHDAQQDLTILSRITSSVPRRIFDTRSAAGFGGLPSTTSLAALLRDVMTVEIPKTETRSNWLRRPLTQNQVAYALNDVRFLPQLRDTLVLRATELDNQDYLREEMERFDAPEFYHEVTPLKVFQRMKTGRLRGRDRVILLELVRFREAAARANDIPRAHVLRDADLQALARQLPCSIDEISRMREIPRGTADRYGQAILTAIAEGKEAAEMENPFELKTMGLPRELKGRVDERIRRIRTAATDAGIDPALIASKAMVSDLVAAEHADRNTKHPLLDGWRKHFVA